MTTMNAATAIQPPIGPINPPNELALRERRRGLLFTMSKAWLCTSAGIAGTMSTSDSRPMFMVALGATTLAARAAGVTKEPGRTAKHKTIRLTEIMKGKRRRPS